MIDMFANILTIFKKEFGGYFRSRLGYVILAAYVVLVFLATFYGTDFLARTNETLLQFFRMQNNALLLIIPALTMKLWTDEQRQNTLELLLSQPVSILSMVLGKFLAAWGLCALLLFSVAGLWMLTGMETALDNTGILINFGACLLMAGALCAVCSAVSAMASHAVSSFIISLLICLILNSLNLEMLLHKADISNEIIIRCSQVFNFEQHFDNIISGRLTISDVFYYISFIILALWFNNAAIEYKRSRPQGRAAFAGFGLMLLFSFLAMNIAVSLVGSSRVFDISAGRKYTLSPATQDWLEKNDKNLYIRLYQSPNLKQIAPELPEYAVYVLNLLEQYQLNSGHKLGLQVVETPPFSVHEAEARQLGVQELVSATSQEPGFLGLVISDDKGNMRALPFLNPQRRNNLEQDISRILSNLEDEKRLDVGILSPAFKVIPSDDAFDHTPAWPVADYLSRDYDLTYVNPNTGQIPMNIDVLLVVNPVEMSNTALYAIDQYLLYGGKVIMFLDTLSDYMVANNILPPQMLSVSYLPDFLHRLGIDYQPDAVIGDMQNARVAEINGSYQKYPFWLDIGSGLYAEHPLMKDVQNITMNSPAGLNITPVSGIRHTVLFRSGENTGEVNSAELSHKNAGQTLKTFRATGKSYPLAVLLEGNFISYFKAPFINAVNDIPFVSISIDEGRFLLVADSDLLMSSSWNANNEPNQEWYNMIPQSGNLDFLTNAIDYMAQSKNPAAVPSKADYFRSQPLASVFSAQAYQKSESVLRQKQAELKQAEDSLQNISAQIEYNELIPSLKTTREIETFERNKMQIRQDLQKINYQMAQEYEFIINRFIALNFCLAFTFIVIAGLIQWVLSRRIGHKAQGYVNG